MLAAARRARLPEVVGGADELVHDLLFVAPCAIRLRMYAFICCAIGEVDSSSGEWHVGQTSSASSSLCVGCCSLANAGSANSERQRGDRSREQSHVERACWMPPSSCWRVAAPTMCPT